jgi:acyl-CoA synthetase (AMP-forming)/AMP-acid ligase II
MIHRSPRPDVHVPDVSLPDFVLEHAASRSDEPALVDGITGDTITYGELDEMSARGAAALTDAGLQLGQTVGLISLNQPLWAVACFAILRAGGVVTPVNPQLTAGEIHKQLQDSQARTVISASADEPKISEAIEGTAVTRRFSLDEGPDALFPLTPTTPSAAPVIDPQAIAALPYSSGTTGASKGVLLTHRNLVAAVVQVSECWRLDDSDVVCAALPLFHIYGMSVLMNSALRAGATLITLPRFDLRTYLDVVKRFGVTRGHLAPPVILALAELPDLEQFDLSSMRLVVSGAAPLPAVLAARFTERTGIRIVQGYGMTEASPGTHSVADDDIDVPADSIGALLPSTQARIVDPETGDDVGDAMPGELWIRGPQVMQGYLGNREATEHTLTDGWLRTGDIVECRDGQFYVVDRLKELIKYNGFQVAPAELESLLLTHPQISDVAVVGIPDPAAGEIPKAFIVVDGSIDIPDLLEWVAARVASYKKIRDVEIVDHIPKSPTGKILRRVLKDTTSTPTKATQKEPTR